VRSDHSATDAVIAAKKSSKLSLLHYLVSPKKLFFDSLFSDASLFPG